jgi:hypothetical protein
MAVGKKLVVCFSSLLLLLVVLIVLVLTSFSNMKNSFDLAVDHRATMLRLAGQFQAEVWRMRNTKEASSCSPIPRTRPPQTIQSKSGTKAWLLASVDSFIEKHN